jgi:hypothetical protein
MTWVMVSIKPLQGNLQGFFWANEIREKSGYQPLRRPH